MNDVIFEQWGADPVKPVAPATVSQAPNIQFESWGPPPTGGEIAADVAKSTGIGTAEGVIGLANIPELGAKGIDAATRFVGRQLGLDLQRPGTQQSLSDQVTGTPKRQTLTGFNLPDAADIQKGIEGYTGEFYKSKTPYGEVGRKVGNYLPALIGGPETLLTKLATRVAAPVAGEELVGKVTDNPYAQAGGAVVASVLAHKAVTPKPPGPPSALQVQTAAETTYNDLRAANVVKPIPQSELDNLASDITRTVNRQGPRPSVAPGGHAAIEEIRTPATAGAADVADLVAARQNLKSFFQNPLPDPNKAVAAIAIPRIDAAIERLSPGTMQRLRAADADYSAAKTAAGLDKRLAKAELRAAGDNSGMNLGNKIRQNATGMLTSAKESRGLGPVEIAALERVARGTPTQNILRFGSNLLGGGGGLGSTLLGVGGAVGGAASGNPELAALPILGFGLRGLANRSTAKQAAKVSELIRSRSPEAQKWAAIQARINAGRPRPTSATQTGLLSGLFASQRGLLDQ